MFLNVVQLAPQELASFWNLGNFYMLVGQYEKAKKAVQKAIDIDPNSAFSHFLFGLIPEK